MKKNTAFLILLLFVGVNSFSQKKNGTVFSEHETIDITREVWKAAVAGDEAKYRSYFADSAYIIRNESDSPKRANAEIGKGLATWSSKYENLKIGDQKPAYPDAIEYKEGGTWVQDWLLMTGIHKETGIVVDLPVHNLYSFNEEGKIRMMSSYFNNDVFEEIANSQTKKLNGKVYINHPYIVHVRKAMNAFVAKDMESLKSFYSPKASFTASWMNLGESQNLEEYIDNVSETFGSDNVKFKVEQVGYPDCVYYEKNNVYVVYSWWNMFIKKDDKKFEIPYMISHDFDEDGKIIREHLYMSSNHWEDF